MDVHRPASIVQSIVQVLAHAQSKLTDSSLGDFGSIQSSKPELDLMGRGGGAKKSLEGPKQFYPTLVKIKFVYYEKIYLDSHAKSHA
jgi:hypothetical protein